tara:strand:- start:1977 stop:2732 length:756 start_codon:yes stop_codon:yes gene_type:complete
MIISARHGVIASTRSKPVSITDPNFGNVVLLLHMDGADEGTAFTDSSSSAHTVTAVGNANTETSVKKFGSASFEGDGTGDYLSIPDNAGWDIGIGGAYGSDIFTLEGWIRSSDITKSNNNVCGFGASGAAHQWLLRHYDNGGTQYLDWQWWNGSSYSNISDTLTNLSFSQDAWYHVAVSHDGTTTSFYFNGSRVGTSTNAYASRVSDIMRVGGADDGSSFHGYIDDFRMTKGTARYSGATITVPTAAFPNS